MFKTVDEKVAAGWVNFHVTGHSLGGAIAELVAMALAHRHPNVRVQVMCLNQSIQIERSIGTVL